MAKTLNINVGILGHVDSGKTTLARALSTVASTAAFDKSVQSQERKITLDLGFSAVQTEMSQELKEKLNCENLQFTFVDCPGHASLIKTVLGGAQIINFVLLVIDVTKGIQAQTLECIVITQITCKRMIIVLNKIDQLDELKREITLKKMINKLRTTFEGKSIEILNIIPVSAQNNLNLDVLLETMKGFSQINEVNDEKSLLFAIDHCFTIKGKGTICTGTVLQGLIKVGNDVEIAQLKIIRKVKSIEMFRKPMEVCHKGDRIGVCITQFDSKLMERGLICTPKSVKECYCAVIKYNPIEFYKGEIKSKMKFHITAGYSTVLATIHLFSGNSDLKPDNYYEFVEKIDDLNKNDAIFVLLEFEKPVLWTENTLLIASRLDFEASQTNCRLAFWGEIEDACVDIKYKESNFFNSLKIYKSKEKVGSIQRVVNEREIIVEDFFKKNSNRETFIGMKVVLSSGQKGKIEGTFGKTSKVKISLDSSLDPSTNPKDISVKLNFNKLVFDKNKKIFQL